MSASQVELRFSATGLANKDFLSLSDPFLVCHVLHNGLITERIGRTETVKDDLNPVWTTTISFAYTPATVASTLLVDVFDRDSVFDDRLTKHDFLGRAVLPLETLLHAASLRLDIKLAAASKLPLKNASEASFLSSMFSSSEGSEAPFGQRTTPRRLISPTSDLPATFSTLSASTDDDDNVHPVAPDLRRATTSARASKNVRGTLSVFAEHLHPRHGMPVVFRVSSALLKETGPLGRKVTQFYELQRERDVEGDVSWSCVLRSKDGLNVDRNNYVVFDEMVLSEQQLNNMQPDRRLRIAFYRRHTRSQHELISYAVTSMADIMASTRSAGAEALRAIPLEGEYGDDDGLGNVLVDCAERKRGKNASSKESGEIHFHLRADHFLHRRYVSSLNDAPSHVRRLRRLPKFITLH